jgi:type IX secretion system PorP/SprF family membrane protein
MKKIVSILLLFCSFHIYSQTSNLRQDSKDAGISGIDFLKYDNITDISHNPGFTGVLEKQTIRFHYTGQWLNMQHFPYNMMVSYDQSVGKDNKYGFGILVNRYQFNTRKLYTVDLSFSVKFRLNDQNTLRWGISAISFNKNEQNTERTGRIYEDMINTFLGPWYTTFERKIEYHENYFDFKTGVWLTNKKYFAGLSILHIAQLSFGNQTQFENSQSKSPNPLPVEAILNGGYELSLGNTVLCTPMIQIDGKFNQPLNISPSLNFTFNENLVFGFTYHNLNVAALNIGARVYDHVNVLVTVGMPVKEKLQMISKLGLLETGISYIF